uniref:Putative exonuclease n=2 Tax=viral metagenome TaxID=1070528 RepID=A0A6M3K347_9ZZZZ
MSKVVLVDFNIFMFRSIFAWEKSRNMLPTYTTLSMLIACLKAVGCHPDDLIILAIDSSKGSWRKDIDPAYKANRREAREKHDINWDEMFSMFKDLLNKLKEATPFVQIVLDYLEADDIISTACRYYKDKEVIIISSDSDYEQLAKYDYVKILSPKDKTYKKVTNPDLILAKKIQKETTDNLVSEINNEEDYLKREKIVNLLSLPSDIEEKVLRVLFEIEPVTNFDINKIPFKTMRDRFMSIYCEGTAEEETIKKIEKKKAKLKKLKQRQLTI